MNQFYKYYGANTAINYVLGEGTIKWSTPYEFNDPFDNQFVLEMEPINEELIGQLAIELDKSEVLAGIQVIDQDDNIILSEENIKHALRSLSQEQKRLIVMDYIQNVCNRVPSFCSFFEQGMSSTVIFCLSETYNNTKMWAHYAEQHTGVVIKFMPADPQSPLQLAKKVNYVSQKPVLKYKDFFLSKSELELQGKITNLIDLYTLTKPKEWAEEQEWRIVTVSRNFQRNSMILEFEPKEIQAIFLGCKISSEDRVRILEIVEKKYPWVQLYQASKSQTNFTLDFDELII